MTYRTELLHLAADQWGMISAAQAQRVGVSAVTLARMASKGELERVRHGIYRLTGSPSGPHDDLRAAWIALDRRQTAGERISAGPVEVVSHRSAASLHGIGDLVADELEFTTSVRRQTRSLDVRIHRGPVGANDWTLVDGLPVTTALRTIRDLAHEQIDRGHLADLVRDALVRQLASPNDVMAVLAPRAHAYGATAGSGGDFMDLLLREAGTPQALLEVMARVNSEMSSTAARQALGSELLPALQKVTASNQQALLAGIRSAVMETIIELSAANETAPDSLSGIRQLVANLPLSVNTLERLQAEIGAEADDSTAAEREGIGPDGNRRPVSEPSSASGEDRDDAEETSRPD